VWCCLDGYGGDPIFNSLLNNDSDEGGFFDVTIDNLLKTEQKYIANTAVLVTTLVSQSGDVLQVKDFAPKTHQESSTCQLIRTITRVRGDPIATIRVRPSFEYNSAEGYQTRGSHHIRYCGTNGTLRLTSNAPIQLLMDESRFLIDEPIFIVFGQDESVTHDIAQTCKDLEDRTIRYWRSWCMQLSVPVDYQDILIRSAITLQLMQSDELGGLITSLTLGIPLGIDVPPTREGRVFHLLDSCLSIPVFRSFGLSFMTRKFLSFIKSIVFKYNNPQAVYDYLGRCPLPGVELSSMAGYLGIGPTVAGGIPENPSPDVGMYGLIIVALCHGFFDVRLKDICSMKVFERLEKFGECALKAFMDMIEGRGLVLSSGIVRGVCPPLLSNQYFEDDMTFLCLRDSEWSSISTPRRQSNVPTIQTQGVHTFTSILCWAACDRLSRIAEHCHWIDKSRQWGVHAAGMRESILNQSVVRGVMSSFWSPSEPVVGPSLLRIAEIGFLSNTDPIFISTINAFEINALSCCISRTPPENRSADWARLVPSTPFQSNTLLWYIEALRAIGKESDARVLFHAFSANANEVGLVSESIDLKDGRHWGNFPHTPTLLGILRTGARLSRDWRGI
jgi:hypothetical protein